jgi:hypothetical protein
LKKLDAFIILLAPIELKSLFDCVDFIDLVITEFSDDISFDYYYPLISLPFLFGIELNDIESNKYLYSDFIKKKYWRNRIISSNKKINVGIVWRGTISIKKVDNQRQIPLNLLLSYLPKGLNYHCIQKELSCDELSLLAERSINVYSNYLIDFSETAALCSNFDLIVTIDTSIAHLAGALGINTFLLLSSSSDWRWHLHGSESLWYKSIKIYRQEKVDHWDHLLNEIRKELLKFV